MSDMMSDRNEQRKAPYRSPSKVVEDYRILFNTLLQEGAQGDLQPERRTHLRAKIFELWLQMTHEERETERRRNGTLIGSL